MTIQTADTIKLIDFKSVCTFVKRFGAEVIEAIHINLEDAEFVRDVIIPKEVIDEMLQVFMGKLTEDEIEVRKDYITFLFDEVVLTNGEEEINQIHAIHEFIQKRKFYVSDIEFDIVLQPIPVQE